MKLIEDYPCEHRPTEHMDSPFRITYPAVRLGKNSVECPCGIWSKRPVTWAYDAEIIIET